MSKIIDRAENVDRGAFASENFWHQFWLRTFSAESVITPDPRAALDIWLFAGKTKAQADQVTLAALQRDGECVRNITKTTPRELRQYVIHTFDEGFLHVIAAPTAEWEQLYEPRVYAPIPVKSGRSYNFAVSVPPKRSQLGAQCVATQESQKQIFGL